MVDRIAVVWGTGEAATRLTAFDAALAEAGVADYNLVALSSVVPPEATVATPGSVDDPYAVGDPIAAVVADATGEAGETLAAGLGWALSPEGGVFMESTAADEAACRADLETKLADVRSGRDWDWETTETVVCDHEVGEGVGAAVVVAVFGPLAFRE